MTCCPSQHKEGYSAPLTAFSWSHRDPSLIVTSSIDTTCTVWDISSGTAITQLIAHDREVYDVCWSSASRDVFASVGADGSVRTFDLRSLDHSTILFESQPPVAAASSSSRRNGTSSASPPAPVGPLLRLKFNSADPNYIAVSSASGIDVNVLDVRVPGVPVVELRAHQANVNGLAWSGEGMILATCGTPPSSPHLHTSSLISMDAQATTRKSSSGTSPTSLRNPPAPPPTPTRAPPRPTRASSATPSWPTRPRKRRTRSPGASRTRTG